VRIDQQRRLELVGGLKNTIMRAIEMPRRDRTTRMRALRRRVLDNDVAKWSASFLQALENVRPGQQITPAETETTDESEAE
jgi:trehalose 6-phosphate synthase